MKAFRKIFVYAIGLLFISCEKKVPFNVPYEGNKIVVNSLIQPDSLIYVRVTSSTPSNVYNEDGFPEIKNPVIVVTADGEQLPDLEPMVINGKTWWVSNTPAVLGKQYQAKVSAAGFTPAEAKDTLPPAPAAEQLGAVRNSKRIQFILKDRSGAMDYYRIRVAATTPDSVTSWLLFRLDPAFNNNLIDFFTRESFTSLVMNDERFDGKTITFVLETAFPIPAKTKLTVEISSLTFSTYQYFSTLLAQSESLSAVTGAPARVFSNVTNGYGILGGINAKKLTITVQ